MMGRQYNDSVLAAMHMLASGMSYTQISEATGISKSTLIRSMREKKKNVADIIKNNV